MFPDQGAERRELAATASREGFDGVMASHFVSASQRSYWMPGYAGVGFGWRWRYFGYWDSVYGPGYVETEYRADYQTDVFTVDAGGGKLIWTGITRSVDLSSHPQHYRRDQPGAGAGSEQASVSSRARAADLHSPGLNAAAGATAELADRIDALLPQTQCTRCGYDGCRPYAEAIASRQGRRSTAVRRGAPPASRALAELLRVEALPLDPACGQEQPEGVALHRPRSLHRLRALPAGLPGRCHPGRAALPAHGAGARLQWLRAVHGGLPGRLHRHAAARGRRSRRRRPPPTVAATSCTERDCSAAARERAAAARRAQAQRAPARAQ